MRGVPTLVVVGLLATVAASPPQRIVGGSLTTVNQYPFAAVIQALISNSWMQVCGGAIINNRSILSAAHCFIHRPANQVRSRIGSSFASSGGVVHNTALIRNHPNYNTITQDNDISVIRVSSNFNLAGVARAGSIAGSNYNLADNQNVWVIGWGLTNWGGQPSEQLRHVQLQTVNQNTCRSRWRDLTDNMLCAIWPNGGRDACSRDSGGPLLHNGVVVGVVSYGDRCTGSPNMPGVYVRVSRYTSWIQQQA